MPTFSQGGMVALVLGLFAVAGHAAMIINIPRLDGPCVCSLSALQHVLACCSIVLSIYECVDAYLLRCMPDSQVCTMVFMLGPTCLQPGLADTAEVQLEAGCDPSSSARC